MNRRLRKLPLSIILTLASFNAYAEDDTSQSSAKDPSVEENVNLESFTVTGSRTPRAFSELPTSVSLIEEPELQQQQAVSTNILENLDVLVPGLTTNQEEFRSGCRTNIRGRQAQFLINGVPTNDNLRRSSCSSLFGLSPFAIERVEVLRGATALFGAGAPGGAINLQTRRAKSEELELDFVTQYSFNPHKIENSGETNVYGGAGQKFDGWDYYVGLGVQDYNKRYNPDDGILPGSSFESYSLNTSVGLDVGRDGKLRFTGLHYIENPNKYYGTDFTQVSGERLADSAFRARPENPLINEAETEQTVLSLSYDQENFLGHTLNTSIYWHKEELIQRSADFFEGDVFYFNSDAENERLGLRTALNKVIAAGDGLLDLTYGVDLLRQSYFRPIVGETDSSEVTGFISPEVELDSAALFFQPQYSVGRWLFTAGVRQEWFEGKVGSKDYDPALSNASTPGDIPDFDLTLFNAGIVYDLTDNHQLFGGFSQGAEIAEFGRAARGIDDPNTINLNAAKSDQYEVGIRGEVGNADYSVAAFYSTSDEAANLQADPRCAGEPICPLIPISLEQDIYGLELTGNWQVNDKLKTGAILTFQRGEFKEPGQRAVPLGSDTLAPFRTTAYLEFEPVTRWKNRIQGTYHAPTDFYNDAEEAMGFRDTENMFIVDFVSSYPVGPGTLTLSVANLLNEEYINATNQASGDFFYYLSEGTRATLGYSIGF